MCFLAAYTVKQNVLLHGILALKSFLLLPTIDLNFFNPYRLSFIQNARGVLWGWFEVPWDWFGMLWGWFDVPWEWFGMSWKSFEVPA